MSSEKTPKPTQLTFLTSAQETTQGQMMMEWFAAWKKSSEEVSNTTLNTEEAEKKQKEVEEQAKIVRDWHIYRERVATLESQSRTHQEDAELERIQPVYERLAKLVEAMRSEPRAMPAAQPRPKQRLRDSAPSQENSPLARLLKLAQPGSVKVYLPGQPGFEEAKAMLSIDELPAFLSLERANELPPIRWPGACCSKRAGIRTTRECCTSWRWPCGDWRQEWSQQTTVRNRSTGTQWREPCAA